MTVAIPTTTKQATTITTTTLNQDNSRIKKRVSTQKRNVTRKPNIVVGNKGNMGHMPMPLISTIIMATQTTATNTTESIVTRTRMTQEMNLHQEKAT